MRITSPAFADGEHIPPQYTCDGGGAIPALQYAAIPDGTKSLALIVHDPDAVRGTFYHWVVYGIAPGADIASGAAGTNSTGRTGWTPPCPPSGAHRYIFTLYALDAEPGVPVRASAEQLTERMDGHILATAALTGLYQRGAR